MDRSRLQYLFQRQLQSTISGEERLELSQFLQDAQNEALVNEHIAELYSNSAEQFQMNPAAADEILEIILNTDKRPAKIRRINTWRWVAAAILIIGVALAVVGILTNNHKGTTPAVATTHDVPAPKETRAVITLANGTKVYLDSVNNGTIAQESNVNVIKTEDGKLIYNANSDQRMANSPVYNTLYNPRGSKVIDMTLSDGSHVWLNAGSSVRYPVAFIGKERVVEITGEAYFEVKHNAKQPFKVHLPNGSVVEDIGTSFNVNAYPDEDAIKTTLIEGSIKISSRLSVLVTKPKVGEQVIDKPNSPLTTNHLPDLEEVMAWKNGIFNFQQQNIETIMKELSRWYDADISYEGAKPDDLFSAIINRNNNVSQVLKMLEQTNSVHFRIEGKKIIVTK